MCAFSIEARHALDPWLVGLIAVWALNAVVFGLWLWLRKRRRWAREADSRSRGISGTRV